MTQYFNDEYNMLDSTGETYRTQNFRLEHGQTLQEAQVRYNFYGKLNTERTNCMVICHALTGNSRLDQWWGSMLGAGKVFDTDKFFVVCANILGSCYGSTGPLSINPATERPYGIDFPKVTIRDSVKLHMKMLVEKLLVNQIECVVGGSLGGMQALEWVLIGREFVKSAVVIACGAQHSAWQIGISELQRQAIYMDPKWNNGNIDFYDPPKIGLSLARQIAMMSYRTHSSYQSKFGREKDNTGNWQVQNYLRYQGEKFWGRFDALTYVKITEIMDSHDIGAYNRGGTKVAMSSITSPILVVAIDSDILYPLSEQQTLAQCISNAQLTTIHSSEGHDAFLLEQEQLGTIIREFFAKTSCCESFSANSRTKM